MIASSAGTAIGDTHYLPVSDHQSENFLTLRSPMTSQDPDKIKGVKVHPVKCPRCKLTVMVKASEKVCPVCGSSLLRPARR